jgi:uncharacterized membrane protein|tara:strand:+ start:221 stop:835 length:615 start_codon:yes stop_codon:yes gene_type:complete
MVTENAELMKMARQSLEGRWWQFIKATLVYYIVLIPIQLISLSLPITSNVISLLVGAPLALGFIIFSLNFTRKKEAKIVDLFQGFNNYKTVLLTYLLVLANVILRMLLLIVPGIIAAFSYSMVFYILADNPDISPTNALKKSKEMMMGYKWKIFFLGLSFLGWALLAILTLGIGLLWLMPYIQVSTINFYEDIKDNNTIPTESV